jgi:hypothetical protein
LAACALYFREPLLQEFWYPKLPPHIDHVLWWLPEDTQTLIVAQGRFAVPEESGLSNVDVRQSLLGFSLGLLSELPGGAWPKEITGRNVSLWLEGSREFRSPKGLGLMPYEGCGIVVFETDLGKAGEALMASLTSRAQATLEVAGQRVIFLQTKMEQDLWRIYVTRLEANALLVATDKEYLETVLQRRAIRGTRRALPPHLPEWRHLDPKAQCWAMRHFDRNDTSLDTSSPLKKFNTLGLDDDQAIGVTFQMSGDNQKAFALHYLSRNSEAVNLMSRFWTQPGLGLRPQIRELRRGAVEVRFSAGSLADPRGLLFVVLCTLGHGIYV